MKKDKCRICKMLVNDPKHRTHYLSGECMMVYDERFPSTYKYKEQPLTAPLVRTKEKK